ncbi:M23 family metallopeptidase [Candidatus Cytomitobacter indipagum]|uniref:M23 family metallopeptidase n=1 Tax=Candidatus Cytomitobacter indipagum TaxID=2601575 RepID=A0A5C0UEB5_9PROT|nr:LysM peptidoglycan-binding domain-containing protein [Candidatus Cytomitobacter indipagum]QEK38099.1 M23 family metallopeptidase [Candidatus Cytomitobacter indipagum]
MLKIASYVFCLVLLGCEKKPIKFVVADSGDTLDTISEKYGINKKHLIEKNNLKHPYIINAGQKLSYSKIETRAKILYKDDEQISDKEKLGKTEELHEIDDELKQDLDKELAEIKIDQEIEKKKQIKIVAGDAKESKAKAKKDNDSAEQFKKNGQETDKKNDPKEEIDKSSILFPTSNGKIDKSLPFSQRHGKRRDGVFVVGTGNIFAPYDGLVMFIEKANNTIYIKKDVGNLSWLVTYSNLAEIFVKKGDLVKQGDKIGYSAGNIFIRIWDGKKYIDPEKIEYAKRY